VRLVLLLVCFEYFFTNRNSTVFVFYSGAPADLVNVRMQNDCKLPKDQRRNYKHAIDGIVRIWREEGPKKLLNGKNPRFQFFMDISFIQVHLWLFIVDLW
jgi:hypothetical protein